MPQGLALGCATCLGVTLLGAMLFAGLISKEVLSESSMGFCAMAVILLAAAAGTAVSVGRIKRQRAMVCALTGGIYYVVLLAITALFFEGQYAGMGETALLVLAGCGVILLLGLREKKSRPARKRKNVHR